MKRRRRPRKGWLLLAAVLLGAGVYLAGTVTKPDLAPGPEKSEAEKLRDEVQTRLQAMTLEEKTAQLFIVTPEALTNNPETATDDAAIQEALLAYPVGGLIYFSRHLITPEQTLAALSGLETITRERGGIPLFLSIDEEGGAIARIGNNPEFGVPSFPNLNEFQTGEEAYQLGDTIGSYLSELGFNLDYAPVADVYTNPLNKVVRYRAFSDDPDVVAELVSEELKGFTKNGILTALKHFPGHGNTAADSHYGYAVTDKTLEELRACEFIPFARGIDSGVGMIMVGHISAPNAAGNDLPSTFSPVMIGDVLRGELGFTGVVITDALNMGAITNQYSSGEAAVMALQAGVDLLLMPVDFQSAYLGVLYAVQNGTISVARIDQSVARILLLKKQSLNW